MKQLKKIYFIYDADGGLWNEIKYWIDKNILKKETTCELCDISHGKIFMRSEWSKFIKELKKDYKVEVLHRNELPKKILDKGYERARKVLTEKIEDLHKLAKALLTYETLTGEEIENIINKNIYPKDKILEKPEDKDDQSSALGAMGLKPKIVH